jgi:Kae1-associated kinase Bud32
MKELTSGAEATIFLDKNQIIKKRVKKNYRIEEIDSVLRKSRTRREAKILEKIPVKAPKILGTNKEDTIQMEFINGKKVRDVLDENVSLAEEIGTKVAKIHDEGIIHGDLTTSNMILKEEIYFIDFGLSFFSEKVEDKAVDIHLLKQALESKHHKVAKKAFEEFLKGYKKANKFKEIMTRFKIVEERGRYKKK